MHLIDKGDEAALLQMYDKCLNRKTLQSKMSKHLEQPAIFVPTKKDIEVFEFISMIIRKNLPVSIVEDNDFR